MVDIKNLTVFQMEMTSDHQQIDILLTGFSLPFDLSPTHEKSKSWKYESCLLLDELSTNCNKMEYNLVVQVNCSAFFSFFL